MVATSLTGGVEPDGEFAAAFCGSIPVSELDIPVALGELGQRTLLEVFLSGGLLFGRAVVPGIGLDIDHDGDGLESIEVDADGRFARCIDGDRTTIPGQGCWRDPRIADGASITVDVSGARARFAGLEPGW